MLPGILYRVKIPDYQCIAVRETDMYKFENAWISSFRSKKEFLFQNAEKFFSVLNRNLSFLLLKAKSKPALTENGFKTLSVYSSSSTESGTSSFVR